MDTDLRLLRSKDVSKILNIGQSTVYKLADRGTLPHVKWEGDNDKTFIRFKPKDILQFIQEHSS